MKPSPQGPASDEGSDPTPSLEIKGTVVRAYSQARPDEGAAAFTASTQKALYVSQ